MFGNLKYLYDLCPCDYILSSREAIVVHRQSESLCEPLRAAIYRLRAVCDRSARGLFFIVLFYMRSQNKAGTSLPHERPEMEQLIHAQAHIRAAISILDPFTVHALPQMNEKERESLHGLARDIVSTLWETDSSTQDLLSAFFIPLYPLQPLTPKKE